MKTIAAVLSLAVAAPASGEVVSSSANGFHVRHSVSVGISADEAYSRFTQIGRWWSDAHTYSGKGANMAMDATVGGCFCETLPSGGGVEHLRVAFADPGKRLLLTGSLGPLLPLATTGAMDIQFKTEDGGTLVTLDYRVAGFASGGADRLAPLVDQVIGEQVARYARAGD